MSDDRENRIFEDPEHENYVPLSITRQRPVPYQRKWATRLLTDIPGSGAYYNPEKSFTAAIKAVLEEAGVNRITEILCYTGDERLETLVYPFIEDADTNQIIQLAIEDDQHNLNATDGLEKQLSLRQAQILNQKTGDSINVQRCRVDFGPIRAVPVATCRLTLRSGAVDSTHIAKSRPVYDLFTRLLAANDPFLYQVLLKKREDDYLASVRLCVVDNSLAVDSRDGFYRLYDQGYPYDVAGLFEPTSLETNFDSPVDNYHRYIIPRSELLVTSSYKKSSAVQAARDWFTGKHEFRKLMSGDLSYPNLDTDDIGYPKFPLPLSRLSDFLILIEHEFETSPWNSVPGRNAPELQVTDRALGASSWQETAEAQSAVSRQHQPGSSATAGNAGHGTGLRNAMEYFEMKGYTFVEVDQDGTSLPDAVGVNPDGELCWLEYENPNAKPENYLKNVSRAIIESIDLHLVVGDKSSQPSAGDSKKPKKAASDMADNLWCPYKAIEADHGTHLYTRSQDIILDDDATVLLPKSASETEWYVTKNDDWKLVCYAGGTRIAEGPATASVTTYEYDCPRYRQLDADTHVIERADGTELARDTTKSAVLDDWTKASVPHLPVRLSYAGTVNIWYEGWNELKRAETAKDWMNISQKMTRYEESIKDFLDTFLAADSDEELLSQHVHRYYKFVLKKITDQKLPDHKSFGMARNNEEYPIKRGGAGGSKGTTLKNVRWALPLQIVSPDIPTLNHDSYGTARDRLEEAVDGQITTGTQIRTHLGEGLPATDDPDTEADSTDEHTGDTQSTESPAAGASADTDAGTAHPDEDADPTQDSSGDDQGTATTPSSDADSRDSDATQSSADTAPTAEPDSGDSDAETPDTVADEPTDNESSNSADTSTTAGEPSQLDEFVDDPDGSSPDDGDESSEMTDK